MIDFKKVQSSIKREYWEYRKLIFGVPILISGLFVVVCILSLMFTDFEQRAERAKEAESSISTTAQKDKLERGTSVLPEANESEKDKSTSEESEEDKTEFSFTGLYVAAAWIVGFYYLLSSLYTDRRDSSILYWKSLPVSETHSVLSKFAFGVVGFPAIALIIAWVCSLVLMVLVFGFSSEADLEIMRQDSAWVFNPERLIVWPIVGILIGLFWGAPVFAYALLVSARSKRLPLLLLVFPLVIIGVLERVIFGSSPILGFFDSHSPLVVLKKIAGSQDLASVFNYFFVDNAASLFIGLLLAALFISGAVWCRNHHFEV